jgi:hypothetical protein
MSYIPGLFKRVCDRTGFAVMSNETVKQWNGIVVRKKNAEPRHPQEFVRGRGDRQTVPMPRARQPEQSVGPLTTETTADVAAGGHLIGVESAAGFVAGDVLGIILDNLDVFRVVLMAVTGLTEIYLSTPLPHPAAAGAMITDYSAIGRSGVVLNIALQAEDGAPLQAEDGAVLTI